MNQPAPRRTSPALVRALIALAVVAFLVGVMAHGAQAAVLNPDYYQKVLRDEDAYDRAYAELPADKVLSPFSKDLLGGVQVPLFDAVPGLLQAAIAPAALESMMDQAIENLIAYLKKHKELDLTLDITEFVVGAPAAGVLTAGTQIATAPPEEAPSIDAFEDSLKDLIEGMSGEGRLPASIPSFDVPPSDRSRVSSLILSEAGVQNGSLEGLATRAAVEAAVAAGATDVAIKAVLVPMLADVSADAQVDLAAGKFVREEQRAGETRYVLGPPPETVKKIDDSLFAIQLVSANSYWLRPVGIGLFLVAVAAVVFVSRTDARSAVRRAGLAVGLAGLVTIVAWLVAMPITQNVVIDAAFEGGRAPSEAFDALARDVLRRCVSNLTPYIFLPAFVAAGIGIALFVLSHTAMKPPRGASSAR